MTAQENATKRWRENNPERWRSSLKSYYQKNREHLLTLRRLRYREQKEQLREYRLKSVYGENFEYAQLLEKQKGLCAICEKPAFPGKCLVVDHDHSTGKVRGLLHSTCNSALGMLYDDPKVLVKAASYITQARDCA